MSRLRELYQQYCADPELLDRTADEALKIYEGAEVVALRHQAESYRHWMQLSIIANDEAARMKDHVKEVVWSDCFLRAISKLEEDGVKPNKDRIEAVARRDPLYQQGMLQLREAEKRAASFKAIEQAFWQRHGMLQSLNSRQCREFSSL